MTEKNYIPEGYKGIKVVGDVFALLSEDFDPVANVILCPRQISGDFDEIARRMAAYFELQEKEIFIKYAERGRIEDFQDSLEEDNLRKCVDIILSDMEFLYHAGARPHMRILKDYAADQPTHKFHVDGLLRDFDRYMTCYNAPVTEFIRNSDVLGVNGHQVLFHPQAKVYGFKVGDIWKSRVRNKRSNPFLTVWRNITQEARKRAFVHRAPRSEHPRVMVVGDLRKT